MVRPSTWAAPAVASSKVSRSVLKALDDGLWKTRISEPRQKGFARWHGDEAARLAVTNNRTRLLSGVA